MPNQHHTTPCKIAILVSGHGRGSNMAAIIDACQSGDVPASVSVVVGTRRDAPAMERARTAGVETVVLSPRAFDGDDQAYADAILQILAQRKIDLVCLAGYMRILPSSIVAAYRNRVMNIHPALLPLFGGPGMYGEHVHKAVLESGMKLSGCTVHFVDEQYDTGPIVVQAAVPVEDCDTPESLAARVLGAEHRAYVDAVRLFARGRLRTEGRYVRVLPEGDPI
jgi:formyltetrahydrofolate-dependent phosphoribosylglycinamide formyltransferase